MEKERDSRVVAVTGAHTDVGKTTLARKLTAILPEAVFIKIGHGERKPDMENIFYHAGTPFSRIARENSGARFMVIESNSLLREVTPECVIYLPGGNPKKSAELARKNADIIRGEKVPPDMVILLAERLGLPEKKILDMIEAAGAVPPGGGQMKGQV